jgi:hypothetical protein
LERGKQGGRDLKGERESAKAKFLRRIKMVFSKEGSFFDRK